MKIFSIPVALFGVLLPRNQPLAAMNQTADLSAIEKRAARGGRRCMLLWAILSTAVYWLSGNNFERSPALGWLLIIVIGGAIPLGMLAFAAVKMHLLKSQT